MTLSTFQTGVIQSANPFSSRNDTTVSISESLEIPTPSYPDQVLVRVLAVALNPSDFKMVKYFPQPDTNLPIGCDFCGVVEDGFGEPVLSSFPKGTRVAGTKFPYGTNTAGAFAEWIVASIDQLIRIPNSMDDLQGASIGGLCWGTCVVALFASEEALALPGSLTRPADRSYPVLVYSAATATGSMACQMLRLAGHKPIAVTSESSVGLACAYGAVGSAVYTSPDCVGAIRALSPNGEPIRYALDCITSPESAAVCFAAIGRAGGRYACLEKFKEEWRTRRAVHTKEVMGFEGFGQKVTLGDETYSREVNTTLKSKTGYWAAEMQASLDAGSIKAHPVRELKGKWEGVIEGLLMLQKGDVRAQKLVVRISSTEPC
ncbi:putative alcohol dehydrogenase [Nemania sp. FL0916]|nr:putative alcohol dehydrogenase [Nemania sp. FL0916]